MTYNVFGGTLSLTQSINQSDEVRVYRYVSSLLWGPGSHVARTVNTASRCSSVILSRCTREITTPTTASTVESPPSITRTSSTWSSQVRRLTQNGQKQNYETR